MVSYQSIKHKLYKIGGFEEDTPPSITVIEYIQNNKRSIWPSVKAYILSLFPFLTWAPRYNLTWLYSDLIAGITVGMVLVPQSLSYAKLAQLPPEYGLYSSFIGVLTYALFATAKDVSIGPVAVMSLETGIIVNHVQQAHPGLYTAPEIATCLAFICGFIVLAIGLLRIGWIIEFIPQPAVSGFMTGSALNIVAGQVPALLGTSKLFDTRAATYKVIINTLKYLPKAGLDAAFGVSALALLYFIKWSLDVVQKRSPKWRRIAFFAQALRHAFVMIIFTIISWRVNIHLKKPRISLVGTVPTGLRHVGQPKITTELIAALGSHLPVATIILLLEHISISKSFGRLNGYKINPNQELIAIGVNNTVGSVFQAYPSTGSFSRSALKSKCGVRTPAAGIPTGIVVIVALYAVAPAFYWIPNAALSALIIHAVADLVASPAQSLGFWRVSPLEYIIFVGAVLWSVFYSIESGIYWSLCASVVLLLYRIARPKGHFLGRVRIRPEGGKPDEVRDVFVPLGGRGGVTNSDIPVEGPPPGVIIYRFEESFLYPNASYINDRLVNYAKEHTRRGKDYSTISKGDRPWNDPGPKKGEELSENDKHKPLLRAVILDFSAVANADTTGIQNLVDARKEVEKWADRHVEFHFTGILSPWIRRALIAGGFGRAHTEGTTHPLEVAPVARSYGYNGNDADPDHQRPIPDVEGGGSRPNSETGSVDKALDGKALNEGVAVATLHGDDPNGHKSTHSLTLLDQHTPFFHFDIEDALNSLNLPEDEVHSQHHHVLPE
ncbi:Sulfate permease 2 [Vanrija albida]|uniref:Sulfate permease 2 n=1 Tax=Vanrija albida TaxID=181172 RepID=A0ABR3QGQ6_9TREE